MSPRLLSLLVLVVVLGERNASAASCAGVMPLEQSFHVADSVYVGTVGAIQGANEFRVLFRVRETLKGNARNEVTLRTDRRFIVDNDYLVFASVGRADNPDAGIYRQVQCAAVTLLNPSTRTELLRRVRAVAREQLDSFERPPVGTYPAVRIREVLPVWPSGVVSSLEQPMVAVEIRVTATGEVADVRILRSQPGFDLAATECVQQWKYLPALVNGVEVPQTLTVGVGFRR